MARMIPPYYENSITSNGEKKLFKALENLGDEYTILHSLGIAEHRDKMFGEIDFVVVCNEGILCLEVKGGMVSRREGLWFFTDRYGRENVKAEGPFFQVVGAMYSLRDLLKKRFGPADPVAVCQYACGVVFPDMPFTWKGSDIIPEIIFDARHSREDLKKYIPGVFAYWKKKLKEKHGLTGGRLTEVHVEKAINYLRGDFGYIPSLGRIVEKTGERLLTLTGEQANRLAIADENPRILMKGNAGTGKTLLGLEYARRNVLRGKKVLFLCFNRNLSRYLRSNFADQSFLQDGRLHITTLHSYLLHSLKKNNCLPAAGRTGDEEYFRHTIPEAFLEMVNCYGSAKAEVYDILVVDEGQDLLRLEYILCMDAIVKGGMEGGSWYICFDPNQNIYNPEMDEVLAAVQEYHPVVLTLDTNCRNTRQIGIYNVLATALPPARYLKVEGEDVVRINYRDFDDEKRKVLTAVKKLMSEGVSPGKICLLSKFRLENSCLQGENIFKNVCKFQNITDRDPAFVLEDSLKFCTIHSFKGLESPVVFLLDLDTLTGRQARFLNYVAISRATSLLYIFYDQTLEEEWNYMVQESSMLLETLLGE